MSHLFKSKFFIAFILVFIFLPTSISAAPRIIQGNVSNALDGTNANTHNITIYKSTTPNINLTDPIGPTCTNGGCLSNEYFVNCNLLSTPCKVNDVITVRVRNNGSNYITWAVNVTVTGAGFNTAPNLTLNTPPNTTFVTTLDDATITPANEVDLLAGSNLTVFCNATITDADGFAGVSSASGVLYDNVSSSSGASDARATHYTNSTCSLFSGSGDKRGAECAFSTAYYANNATWSCNVTATDNHSIKGRQGVDYANMNELIALGIPDTINFGSVSPGGTSIINKTNVTNLGNKELDLSIYGYANNFTTSDNAMNCTNNANITLGYLRYNITAGADPSFCKAADFSWTANYWNLTNSSNAKNWTSFNLGKQNTEGTLMRNYTCWILQLPLGVSGTCRGVVSISAFKST